MRRTRRAHAIKLRKMRSWRCAPYLGIPATRHQLGLLKTKARPDWQDSGVVGQAQIQLELGANSIGCARRHPRNRRVLSSHREIHQADVHEGGVQTRDAVPKPATPRGGTKKMIPAGFPGAGPLQICYNRS